MVSKNMLWCKYGIFSQKSCANLRQFNVTYLKYTRN
jgi:hypothetical protein